MANELFTISKGDRSDKPNVLLVLTDGRPKLPRDEDFDYGILDNINEQLKVLTAWQWRIQGMDPGSRGAMVPLLFLDKNEARRAEKMLGGPPPSPPPPPSEKILDDRTSPLSQGLDTALLDVMFWACGMF